MILFPMYALSVYLSAFALWRINVFIFTRDLISMQMLCVTDHC